MRIEFEVGEKEKHTVIAEYSKWTGKMEISVDAKNIISKNVACEFKQPYFKFDVGSKEKHKVEVLLKGLVLTSFEVLIDGKIKNTG